MGECSSDAIIDLARVFDPDAAYGGCLRHCRKIWIHEICSGSEKVDGGFGMLMGDFLSLTQLKLPVKVVVFNNGSKGAGQLRATNMPDGRRLGALYSVRKC